MVASGFSLANTVLPATQHLAACGVHLGRVGERDAAVDLDHGPRAAAVDLPAELGHFLGRSFDERLDPPNPGSTLITSTRSSSFR